MADLGARGAAARDVLGRLHVHVAFVVHAPVEIETVSARPAARSGLAAFSPTSELAELLRRAD